MFHFATPITTIHAEARKMIAHHNHMLDRIATMHNRDGRQREMMIELRKKQIAREEAVLTQPNQFRFPTFFWFNVGENQFGISLAGLRCNIPALARRYGEEMEYAGNSLYYRNWLGHHYDL